MNPVRTKRRFPPPPTGVSMAKWAAMIRSGLVTPGKGPIPPYHLRRLDIKAKDVKGSVVQALIDERDEHR